MSTDTHFLLLSLLGSVKAPMNNTTSQNGKSLSGISSKQITLCLKTLLPIFINYALIGQEVTNNTMLIFKTQLNYFTTKTVGTVNPSYNLQSFNTHYTTCCGFNCKILSGITAIKFTL